MTSTRYLFARVGQAFGIHRRTQRMGDAASEMHLLRDAELYLGAAVWEKVEPIEELSVEYWNLRKLLKEREDVIGRLAACEEKLRKAHDERAAMLTAQSEPQQGLLDERAVILKKLEALAQKRDEIVAQARGIRRTYDGLKMKLEVLAKEAGEDKAVAGEEDRVRERLRELKKTFTELKEARTRVGKEIEAGDGEIDRIDEQLASEKQQRRQQASDAFQVIGDANKEISTLRAELGLLETRMHQLQAEIGRHVSRHVDDNPACAEATREHRGLVEVMRALRRSIALNHRLAGMS